MNYQTTQTKVETNLYWTHIYAWNFLAALIPVAITMLNYSHIDFCKSTMEIILEIGMTVVCTLGISALCDGIMTAVVFGIASMRIASKIAKNEIVKKNVIMRNALVKELNHKILKMQMSNEILNPAVSLPISAMDYARLIANHQYKEIVKMIANENPELGKTITEIIPDYNYLIDLYKQYINTQADLQNMIRIRVTPYARDIYSDLTDTEINTLVDMTMLKSNAVPLSDFPEWNIQIYPNDPSPMDYGLRMDYKFFQTMN